VLRDIPQTAAMTRHPVGSGETAVSWQTESIQKGKDAKARAFSVWEY